MFEVGDKVMVVGYDDDEDVEWFHLDGQVGTVVRTNYHLLYPVEITIDKMIDKYGDGCTWSMLEGELIKL